MTPIEIAVKRIDHEEQDLLATLNAAFSNVIAGCENKSKYEEKQCVEKLFNLAKSVITSHREKVVSQLTPAVRTSAALAKAISYGQASIDTVHGCILVEVGKGFEILTGGEQRENDLDQFVEQTNARIKDLLTMAMSEKLPATAEKEPIRSKLVRVLSSRAMVWADIEAAGGMSKYKFAKKISFVKQPFKRKVIFRDVEDAFWLAKNGFPKPAVILAGSVIEELLRLYLESKNIKADKNTFDSYIKACESNDLLKMAVHRLTDSLRHFRNLIHLEKEVSPRETIELPTSQSAVNTIFTLANDFRR